MNRRDFLKLSAGMALLPLGGGAWAAAAEGGPRRLIVILLRGAAESTPTLPTVAENEPLDPMRLEEVLGSSLTARTRAAVAAAPAESRAAMILGSPDFVQR